MHFRFLTHGYNNQKLVFFKIFFFFLKRAINQVECHLLHIGLRSHDPKIKHLTETDNDQSTTMLFYTVRSILSSDKLFETNQTDPEFNSTQFPFSMKIPERERLTFLVAGRSCCWWWWRDWEDREGRRAKTGTKIPKAMRERKMMKNKVSFVLPFLTIVDHLELDTKLWYWFLYLFIPLQGGDNWVSVSLNGRAKLSVSLFSNLQNNLDQIFFLHLQNNPFSVRPLTAK